MHTQLLLLMKTNVHQKRITDPTVRNGEARTIHFLSSEYCELATAPFVRCCGSVGLLCRRLALMGVSCLNRVGVLVRFGCTLFFLFRLFPSILFDVYGSLGLLNAIVLRPPASLFLIGIL